jgi:hypothetical protein
MQIGRGGFGRSWAEIVRGSGVQLVGVVDPSPLAQEWARSPLGLADDTILPGMDEAFAAVDTGAAFFPDAAGMAKRMLMVSQDYRNWSVATAAGTPGALTAVRVRRLRETCALWPADNVRYHMQHPLVLDMGIPHAELPRAITGEEVVSINARGWRVPDSPSAFDPAVAAVMTLSGGATVLYEGDWATREPETSWNGAWEFIRERGWLPKRGDLGDALAGRISHPLADWWCAARS